MFISQNENLFLQCGNFPLFSEIRTILHYYGSGQLVILFHLFLKCFLDIFEFLLLVVENVVSDCFVRFLGAVCFDFFQRGINDAKLKLFSEFTLEEGGVVCHIEVLNGTYVGEATKKLVRIYKELKESNARFLSNFSLNSSKS